MSIRAVLGTFDGVHLGHAELFCRAHKLSALDGMQVAALVIDRGGECITPVGERCRILLASAMAESVHVIPLGEVKGMDAADFVKFIKKEYGVCAAVCGYDFRFGRDRHGDAGLLCSLLPTEVVGEVTYLSKRVSSTRIRTLIAEGNVDLAAKLMNRPFTVEGEVVGGKSLGNTRGVPTANVHYPTNCATLRRGVYFTLAEVGGQCFPAVTNVGVCPTVGGEQAVIESFFLDYGGSLYGKNIRVQFLAFHRDEVRFDCLDGLYRQVSLDISEAKKFFEGYLKGGEE